MGAVISLFLLLLQLYSFVLLARVLMSWFPNLDRSNPIVQLIYDITEPVLRPVREMLPPVSGLDLSPLVVFLGISVLMQVLRAF